MNICGSLLFRDFCGTLLPGSGGGVLSAVNYGQLFRLRWPVFLCFFLLNV